MELAEEFLKNANECLRLAEEANALEAQIHWLSMAQFWRCLAQQVVEEDAIGQSDPAIRGKPNGEENGNGDSSQEH